MKHFKILLGLLISLTFVPIQAIAENGEIHVTLLHFNDVYEIMPVNNGKEGGLARVATVREQLKAQNPNTITLLGGDFFNPSAIGTAKINGEALAGKQMVDVLNVLGLDYATFGNHEFDLKENQFRQRMSENKFGWIASNVFDAQGKLFNGVQKQQVLTFHDEHGKTFKLGLFGITLTSNQPNYVSYSDPAKTAAEQAKSLSEQSNFVIALTHQSIEDDEKLAQQNPSVDLILGGHEHVNYQYWRGNKLVPILKADGNARSVYVIDLYFNPATGHTRIKPKFLPINDSIAEHSAVKQVVDKWKTAAFDAFRAQGLNPEESVTTLSEPLDGLSAHVRTGSTNLTQLIATSLLQQYPNQADLSLYNSGTIRIDDVLPAGTVSVYDIIRVLPFGGEVRLVSMKGSLLQKVLQQGDNNIGSGGYLQSANTSKATDGSWLIAGKTIDPEASYKIAIADYLLTGNERNLDYLTDKNPELKVLEQGRGSDVRKLLIEKLRGK